MALNLSAVRVILRWDEAGLVMTDENGGQWRGPGGVIVSTARGPLVKTVLYLSVFNRDPEIGPRRFVGITFCRQQQVEHA
jgi:hypothetical protein